MLRDIRGQSVLVVGGAGFIGSHLADALWEAGAAQVTLLDNMFLGRESNVRAALQKGAVLYKDDAEFLPSLKAIIRKHRVQTVFNLATKALNYSFINPMNAFTTNVTVAGNLLELLREGEYQTLCHYSSSEVYGTAAYEPMDEKHPVRPTTAYAGGKAAADIMLRTYVNMFGVDAFIIRPFNNYGPRQNWEGELAAIIPATARRILRGEKPILNGTGEQKRDFIFVKDTVLATLALYPTMAKGDEVNVAADSSVSMNELVARICKLMGYTGEIERMPARGADVQCHNASNAYLRSLIAFSPRGLDAGLAETLAWYREAIER